MDNRLDLGKLTLELDLQEHDRERHVERRGSPQPPPGTAPAEKRSALGAGAGAHYLDRAGGWRKQPSPKLIYSGDLLGYLLSERDRQAEAPDKARPAHRKSMWSVWRCCHPVVTVEMAFLRPGRLGRDLGT